MSSYFNLINLTKSNTNIRILGNLFESHKNEWVSNTYID